MKSSKQSASPPPENVEGGASEPPPAPRLPRDLSDALPERSSLELHRFYLLGERPEGAADAAPITPLAAYAFPRDESKEATDCALPGDAESVALRYATALARERAAAVSELARSVTEALTQVRGVVLSDAQHAPESHGAEALGKSLGGPSGGHIDFASLARQLPDDRGPKRLDESRRQVLNELCETLEAGKRSLESARAYLFVTEGALGDAREPSVRVEHCEDPHAAAIDRMDALTRTHVDLARALRRARLEKAHAYKPELHDAWLAALELGALSELERRALPTVVLVETLAEVEPHLPRLLAEERPVHALLSEPPVGEGRVGSPFGGRLAGLARAFERSYVASVDARSVEGADKALEPMVRHVGPALALLPEVPLAVDRALYGQLAHASGAHLAFAYDPGAGPATERWRSAEGGAVPSRGSALSVPCVAPGGEETALEYHLSAADLACLQSSVAKHLCVLRPEQWAADQRPLDSVLEDWERREERADLPFVWGVDADHSVVRILVDRSLAERARERRRAARALAEFSGIDDPWAGAAAARTREELEADFAREREGIETRHAEATQAARESAAHDAMVRVINVLVNLSPEKVTSFLNEASAPAPKTPMAPAVSTTPEALSAPAAPDNPTAPRVTDASAAAEPAIPRAADAGPFVDTPNCTTCNECVDGFPDVFAYNADKQAEIVAKRPPPFASLVKAAERCGDECIYPGAPRPGDPTVTPALIERAKKFT